MKNGFGKRLISMMMAICMILTVCPVSALAVNEGEPQTITVGELVAGTYSDLSQEEKNLIGSGLLADVTYEYYVPGESHELIEVDTENKTVTADPWTDSEGNVWNPVDADIIVNGSSVECVVPDGVATYAYDGNAFSVKVSYEMYISVDTAIQEQLLNTSGWLKDGIANLETIAGQSTNMGVVELAMPQLLELRDMSISLGQSSVELSSTGKEAITAMNDQMAANDGMLKLNAMVSEYRTGTKTEYLLNSGSAMQPELTALTTYVSDLAEALNTMNNNISVFVQYGFVDAATGEMISLLTEKVNALKAGLESAANGDWTAAEMGTALVKADISAEDYIALDALVGALGEVKSAEDISITENILAAETAIQYNLSMKNVTVQVKLLVVENALDSDVLVSGGETKTVVLTLAENATKEEIIAALDAESAIVEEAIASWGDAYVADHYVSSDTELPENLTEDITYTLTFSPATYVITYDYDEGVAEKSVPYGYKTMLEVYTGAESKVYDYTVGGTYYPQGSIYTVRGDVTVTRETGKPYTRTDLYTAIAAMEGVTDKEKAILTAGALLGNTVMIDVRYPDTDAGSLVSIDSNLVLTGRTYASDYEGLVWAPYNYIVTAGDGTDSDPAAFTQNGDVYTARITDSTFQAIKVYYRLSLANFGEDAAQVALDLVEKLVSDAERQNSALASLSSDNVSNNLDMLDAVILDTLEGLVNRNTLNTDAIKNEQLKECFNTVIGKIKANCLDVNGAPRIGALIDAYINSGKNLAYYYRNNQSFITEVSLLSQYLNEMLAEDGNLTADEKLAALAILIGAAPDSMIPPEKVEEYSQKLPDLQSRMNEINANLTPVDPAIDTTSSNLNKLVNALQMSGTVGTDCDGYVYLQSQSFNLAGSGKVILKVNVMYGEDERSVSETVDQNSPVLQSAVDSLKDKVAALLAEMGIDDAFWYDSEAYDDGAALDALVGQSYATNQTFSFTWVMLEHTYCEINGHTEQVVPGKAPTCTGTGLTDGMKCSVCGETLVEQEEIPAAGHTEEVIHGKAPTCTGTGLTDGLKCSVCNEILVRQETIPAAGHDYSDEWTSNETGHWHVCSADGCGAIDAVVAHTYDTDDCTAEAHCTICNYTKEAGRHAWGPLVNVDAEKHKQVCSSCQAEQENPHSWTLVEEVDATCEADGHKKYTCSCGAEKTDVQTKLGHAWSDWTKVDDEKHTRVCGNDAAHAETADHTWDNGVENADGDMVYTCTAGCGATKLVVLNKEEKLESGATIKAQLTPAQDGSVVLPKPEADGYDGTGYRYDYVINGVTHKVTNDGDDDPIYPGSVAGATVKLVNIDNEKLETLLTAMGGGAKVEKDPDLKPTNDGYYTGIKVETDVNGMMGVVMALVQNKDYGYVALDEEPLLNNNKVSLLGLLRMMMGPDGVYTSKDLINLSNGSDKTLVSSQLVLRASAPSTYALRRSTAANDGHELEFEILLTATPAEMGTIGAALAAVQSYITFDIKAAKDNGVLVSNRLDVDVKANLPAKVYEIYVAALRLTGNVDVNDANAVKEAVIYEFLKDYVDVLMGADVTTTTLMNTAAKLGRTVDLTAYEGMFNALKGKLGNGANITYSGDGLSALATFTNDEMEKVVDKLEPMVGDADLMNILKSMLVECQPGETVDIKLNAFVTNFTDGDDSDDFIDTEYEAIIIDVAAANKPGVEKIDIFDITEDLSASVADLESYAAIMLQKDVTCDLHFKNATVLDLNGHKITGTITADAKLIIIDSTLATATVGGVTGVITGSDVTILAGTYGTTLNSSFLKTGYTQNDNGTVVNEYYEIKKDGNDITFEVNADVLATRELPSIWLAADMAADLAMNYFTSAALSFDNKYVYEVDFEDLLNLISSETTGEEKVNEVLDILKVSGADGIEGFINDLLAKSMDFAALAEAINGNTSVVKYNMVTAPWTVKLNRVDGEDYLTVGIEPGDEVNGSVAVVIVGTDAHKAKIADLLAELGKIMKTADNSITVALQDPAYTNGALTISGNGDVKITVDMSENADYAAIAAVILAKNGVNKTTFIDALKAYFADSEDTDALYEALSQVTMAQYISAVKSLSLSKNFSAMAAELSVTPTASAVELGDTFHMALVAAGRVLTKLEINGDSRILFGTSGENSYTATNITRNISRTVSGITVSGTVTADSVSVTVKLFPAICDHDYDSVVTPPTCVDGGYTTHTCSKCGDSYVDGEVGPTGVHTDDDGDDYCDDCGDYLGSDDPGYVYGGIEVLNAEQILVLETGSFSEAVKAAKEGYTIRIYNYVSMTEHVYLNCGVNIIGAGRLNDTGYVIYLADAAAKVTADAKLNIGSSVDGYKAVCAESENFTYTLEKINAPKTDAPVAGSKVASVNDKLYLLLDLSNDGMTLNALRENTAFADLVGTIKFEIEGNDGTGLIKTTDRMTVSTYNADNNCVATVTYVVIVMGDTNCNGKVNTSDATIMKNINFGETYDLEVLIAADVNFSGSFEKPKVNSSDATYIMSKWFNWSTGKYKTNLE